MNNTANTSSSVPVCADESLFAQSVIIAICYSLMCIAGIIAYTLFVVIVIKYKKTTFKNSFYTLAISLAGPDLLTLICELFYCVPAIFRCDVPYGYGFAAGCLVNMSWYILSSHMAIISVNRFVAVVFNPHYASLFSDTRVYILIAISYAYGIVMKILLYYADCSYLYFGYGWMINCDPTKFAAIFTPIDQTFSEGSIVLVVFLYLCIFIYVKIQGRKMGEAARSSQSKRERNLMLQFLLLAVVLVVYEASFWVVPAMMTAGILSGNQTSILINTFGILNSGLPPFLYMTFGSDLKRILLGGAKSIGPTSMATTKVGVAPPTTKQPQLNVEEIDI